MKHLILMLAMVGLLAGTSMGATYIVKYAATPPTGPTDPVWSSANLYPTYSCTNSANVPSANFAYDVRYLWDGNFLYARAMVTDNIHVLNSTVAGAGGTGDMGNYYQWDVIEFYVNAPNNAGAAFVAGTTQDVWGLDQTGAVFRSNSGLNPLPPFATAAANVVAWTDPLFDPTGTVGGATNGNYGLQIKWSWTAAPALGGLSQSASPTAGQLLRLGFGVNDDDNQPPTSGTQAHDAVSANYAGNGAINAGYNNVGNYGAAQLVSLNPLVNGASIVSQTTVNVLYAVNSSATAMGASAANPANYALSGGATVSAASLQADGLTVQLTTSPLTVGTTYTLTVSGAMDAAGNLIAPNPSIKTFVVPTVKVTTQHIAPGGGTNFTLIPNPSPLDLAQSATFSSGTALAGGAFAKLQDGQIQPTADDPADSAYFNSAASITVDLHTVVPVSMINTYSRHENTGEIGGGARAPQVYNLYGSTDGVAYTLIVSVSNTIGGGAWGNSITAWGDGNVSFGSYRYLRFDTLQAPAGTTASWTFYGEIDVFASAANPALTGATYVNPTTINATFIGSTTSSAMNPGTAATIANYALDNGATVLAATLLSDGVTVQLTTSALTPSTTYHLTVANLMDTVGNTMSPNPSAATFATPLRPTITSATATNLTQVTVVFSKSVDAVTAGNATNYTIAGLTVGSATVVNATTVRLGVSLMSVSTSYTLTVNNVLDTTVPPIMIAANSTKGFTTPAAPTVTSVTATGGTSVTVAFSKAMSSTTLTNLANYAISSGVSVTAATASANGVTLTVSGLTAGTSYILSVSNVQDIAGITISPNPSMTTFFCKVILIQYPFGTAAGSSTTTAGGLSAVETFTVNAAAQFDTWSETRDSGLSNALSWGANSTGSGGSYAANMYVEFGFTVAPGYTANLSSLNFLAACNWGNDPKGIFVESSLSGYSASTSSMIMPATLLNSWQGVAGGRQAAPYYNTCAVDLSGAAFQNIPAGAVVTFRIYGFSNNSENWALMLDNVTLWGGTTAMGTPPTVAITSPTSTYNATIGNPVTLTAVPTITNSAAVFSTIRFYDGATLLGAGLANGSGGYTYRWNTTGVTAGNHSVTAVVTDSMTGQGTSPAVVVNFSTSTPPSVTLTAPASGLIAGQGWLIALSATTTNGTPYVVTGVDFYLDGGTQVGGHGTLVSPGVYSSAWDSTTAPFGPHSLLAKVTDGGGLTGSSNSVSIVFRIPGDGNGDNIVDGEDYGIWQNGYNHPGATMNTGDYNGDGIVDGEDYGVWQNNYNRTAGLEDVVAASSADVAATPMVGSAAPKLVSVTPTASAVALVFDTDVVVGGSAVEVAGLVSGPQAYTAAYDAATKTLTLTFASGLSADTYTVRVIGSFVVAADGGASLAGDAQAQFSAE